ncbi:MAG: 4-hydroxy-tetrahydrodipicolinate synthase [Erysipelotrichaceae bacterium]|nr:4-hydroxy-tetrahydrodipicolinate synthase [Erysipelotrichaceae bacterium]
MSRFLLYTALVTPFTEEDLIDFDALGKLVESQIEAGYEGLIVLGTTGEAAALSLDERVMVIRYLRKIIPDTVSMIVGVGSNNLEETLRNIQIASELKADAVLVVTPYYVCPNQEGLYRYYERIAKHCPLPIYLYNVKRRCGVELEPKTVDRLISKYTNIIGLKQAGGGYDQYVYLKKKYPHFQLFSGDDGKIFEAMELGFDGIISVLSNALPEVFVEYRKKFNRKEYEGDLKDLEWMCGVLYSEPTPAPTKYVLSRRGIGNGKLRLPLCEVSDELRDVLEYLV